MKIKIFHGDNLVESRMALSQEVSKARKAGMEVVTVSGVKADFTQIRSALESGSLFGQDKLVVIEDFLSSSSSSFKKKTLAYLKKAQFENELILWEGREIKNLPLKVETKLFRLDPILFRFLESLKQGSPEASLELLRQLKKKEKPEMIFHMMTRQIRLLILAKDLGEEGLASLASWQKGKLIRQAQAFDLNHLVFLFGKLLEIDLEQKTSSDPFPLSSRLDLLVSEI